ncbi:DUF4376 domain-containing protein [Xanthobacter autotrophicus]|uniref:DUF4376 domain-containing protein n=1 Tax=Xanthobacter autotrophicus TaxID=280 RepID=UPI00372A612E
MRVAFHKDGVCTHVLNCAEGWEDLFPDEAGVASDTANVGDIWDETGFHSPAPPAPTSADLLAYAADKRWLVETGGIVVSGESIRTDEKSQAKITGALQLLAADQTITGIDWEAQPGVWVTLDAITMKNIGVAVGRHVQACFSTLKSVQEEITSGAITTYAEIDNAAWPANS